MEQRIRIIREKDRPKKIFKFSLQDFSGLLDISMPPIYNILKVDIQNGKPVFWAIVYNEEKEKKYQIISLWTGMTFKEEYGTYIGSLTIDSLVYHYFIKEIYE